ncbi:DUF4179 domain-containing protein [Rossellomorea sp. SC111]|uniref:DUF4179 domain-containing protein n=1 Tax=Rossellomorea sp. SC111 TaxID=2968985 RepID=UPI00215A21EE|nr:DUF4179 domain-containing protein [Rossellomorea sp. SC111]MCR8849381.1 DUF4179 domain-containing protein [Rossellomorea sp. SC111]
MDRQLKKVKAHFEHHYYDDEMTDKLKHIVMKEVHKTPKKFYRNHITYFSSVAILAIVVLIGSTFLSPTMAAVMSNVPYFDEIFSSMQDSEDQEKRMDIFYDDVTKRVKDKMPEGVVDTSLFTSHFSKKPNFTLMVDDKKWKKEYEKEFEDIVNSMAIKNHIDHYKTEVTVIDPPETIVSEKEKERMEYLNKVYNTIDTVLTTNHFNKSQVDIDPQTKTATIKVAFNKTNNTKHVTENLTNKLEEAFQKENIQDLAIKIKKRSKSEIWDEEWQPIFTSIMEVSSDKFTEVNGFAYSFHPAPLEIIIKTSLPKNEKNKAKEINDYVKQIIDVKKKELSVEDIPYKIIIRDKKHKQMYEELYE